MDIFVFGKKYTIPYQQTYFIPERIFKFQIGIYTQSLGYKEGTYLSYQMYIDGKPNAIVQTPWDLGILIESVIARKLGWTDFEKHKHGMFIDGNCYFNETVYEAFDREFRIWTSTDKSCWQYKSGDDCPKCGNDISPLYNSAKVQPSFAHFRRWAISTIKEI